MVNVDVIVISLVEVYVYVLVIGGSVAVSLLVIVVVTCNFVSAIVSACQIIGLTGKVYVVVETLVVVDVSIYRDFSKEVISSSIKCLQS